MEEIMLFKRKDMFNDRDTVMVSGGFDPLHIGHVQMILEAAKWGDVIVVLNSDEWLKRKKNFIFMPWPERAAILYAIKGVIQVSEVDDKDNSVCEAIRRLLPTYFANGGDRSPINTPEISACEALDVHLLWNIGGDKVQSSSELVENANKEKNTTKNL
jgi:D-beta-D-heptose 7-phosphate kinase/D-beta-D-heptose 1-phosphate adenosyltransferase